MPAANRVDPGPRGIGDDRHIVSAYGDAGARHQIWLGPGGGAGKREPDQPDFNVVPDDLQDAVTFVVDNDRNRYLND